MSMLRETLQANLRAVHERITKAARGAGRDPEGIRLLAVSKSFPAAAIIDAAHAGQRAFGENYVQEALQKMAEVQSEAPELALEWHFIGPIQSNKTRAIAEHFDWVQSVDRLRIAERLSEQRPASLSPLNILLQVNISGEASKSGVAPEEAAALAAAVDRLPGLRLRGLMAIPEPEAEIARQFPPLVKMKRLFDQLRSDGLPLDTLSLGMSADLEAAVATGSTMVRIGTAIFGERERQHA
jgi:pyridoxal phosphate enzyme (YggS family)